MIVASRAVCLTFLGALTSGLASVSKAESPTSLVYRRVFVPQDELNAQIRGLLPMKRDEFERRIRAASSHDPAEDTIKTRIEQAVFRARIEGNQILDGTAELTITVGDGAPSLLSLDPCDLLVYAANWKMDDQHPVVLGADPIGGLHCLVERSGVLSLRWDHATAVGTANDMVFDLRLPMAIQRQLQITTSTNVELTCESGLVSSREIPGPEMGRLWTIQLDGRPLTRLGIRKIQRGPSAAPPFIVREATNCAVVGSSVDFETTFALDVLQAPLEQLELRVDSTVQVTDVRIAERTVPFRRMSAGPDKPATIVVEFPEPLVGLGQAIEIAATCEWHAGGTWSLPRFNVPNGIYQEGRLEIHAPSWLQLQARPLRGCIQTVTSAAGASRGNDRFEFQLFESDATLEISSGQAVAFLNEESGTQITVESNQIAAVMVAELTARGGAPFSLTALVSRQWIIDSVETQPPEVLADRSLSARGSEARLQLKMTRPLTAQRPVRLVIRAHYRRPPNRQPLRSEFFHMVRFPDARSRRRLVSVRVNDPGTELRLAGDENLVKVHPTQLSPAELRLFEDSPGSLIFDAESAGDSLTATLEAASARYRADVFVRADVAAGGGIGHKLSLHCQPEASAVGSVLVRLAPRPHADLRWRLVGEETRNLTGAMEVPAEASSGSDSATYRLILPRPQSSAFEITCQWPESLPAEDDVVLASLPEAHQQTGIVEIHSLDRGIMIRTNDVQPLPRPPSYDDRITTLRGRYRYEAGRRGRISVEPAEYGAVQQGAWVEMFQLISQFSPDGIGEHEASLAIKNAGLAEFSMQFPPTADHYRLVTEKDMEEPLRPLGAGGEIRVPLSELQRQAVVRVRYTTHGRGLGAWPMGRFETPVPRVDLPVLAGSWQVHLPPGIEAIAPQRIEFSDEDRHSPHSTKTDSLFESLIGPELPRRLGLLASSARRPSSDPAFRGWQVVNLPLPESGDAIITVYQGHIASTWSACLGLIAASIVLRLREPQRWIGPIIALLAAGAIASEAPLAWPLGWMAVGVMVASGIVLFRRRSKNPLTTSASLAGRSTILLPARGGGVAVLFVLAIASARCVHSAPLIARSSDPARRDRVIFPIDAMQQPAGDYVYLEPDFYEALHRLSSTSRLNSPSWLVESARYRFSVPSLEHAAGAGDVQASFEIHSLQPETTVTLPLRRDQVLLVEGRAKLDGQPTTLAWANDGNGLSIAIQNPGKHRLEISVVPIARTTAERLSVDMTLPRAAISVAVLPSTAEVSDQVVVSPMQSDSVDSMRQIYLRGDRLTVRWPVADGGVLARPAEEGGQCLWWRIRPGSVTLEGRFQLRQKGGAAHDVSIEVDGRLRLLPRVNSESIPLVRVEEGATNRIRVAVGEHAPEVNFRLSWLWPDASGPGKLVLPKVRLLTERTTHDLTAISADSGLTVNGLSAADGEVSPDEFLRIWGETDLRPDLLFRQSAVDQYPTVFVTPRQSSPAVKQLVEWSVSKSAAMMLGTLKLTGVPGSRFEHRVLLPAPLKVRQVRLSQSGRDAGFRWTQQSDGSLVVTLLESPAPAQTLTIAAELANNQPRFELPTMRLADAIYGGERLRIYRRPDVQLQVQGLDGWNTDDELPSDHGHEQGRLITALAAADAAAETQPTIARTANRPRVAGKMLIRAIQADGDWRCEANLDLEISNGVLDELRFSLPEELPGPLESEPAMEARMDAVAGDRRREFILHPREAVQGHFTLKLRGSLHSGATGVQAPDIALVGHRQVDRLVWLDRGPVGERIYWETATGLLAASPSAITSLPAGWRDGSGDLYRVTGSHFDALARAQHGTNRLPRVHLAEFRASVQSGRHVSVVAMLTVQPAGRSDATFLLPPGCRFVQAMIDGVAAPCAPVGLRAWKIDAPSDLLPYRLTLVYDTLLAVKGKAAHEVRFLAPRISGMEIQQSLWSIKLDGADSSLDETRAYISGRVAETCDSAHAALARLEASVRALEDVSAAQGTNLPSTVIAENFWRWQYAVNLDHERLLHAAGSSDLAGPLASKLQELMEKVARVRQRLIQAGIVDELELPPAGVAPTIGEAAAAIRLTTSGAAEDLRISWPVKRSVPSPRMAAALGLAIFALLLGSFERNDAMRSWLLAHSHLAVAAMAVGWWLMAPFGWLGWPVLLAAVWLALYSPVRGPRAGHQSALAFASKGSARARRAVAD